MSRSLHSRPRAARDPRGTGDDSASWRFYDPIILPDGRELRTYRDAAEYICALPKAEQDAADWLIAMETLLLVAERNAPEMLARIAIVKALDRHVKPT